VTEHASKKLRAAGQRLPLTLPTNFAEAREASTGQATPVMSDWSLNRRLNLENFDEGLIANALVYAEDKPSITQVAV
jgi:hypothetical protein